MMPRLKALFLSLATLSATAFGQAANQARPGTLNYIEGQASIEGRPVTPNSVGNSVLEARQYLSTANGKVEVLLTPGVFLRLGNDTTVQIVSPNLTKTEVRLEKGQANVEVDQLYKESVLLVDLRNSQIQLIQNGLYTFDADNSTVRVFKGRANVFPGENLPSDVKPIDVKGSHQLVLTGERDKPQRFDKDKSQDDLYRWSSLRSQYLGEANIGLAEQYTGDARFYPGWYWAGGLYGYTWLPGDGLFWSPFGYGFYSPWYLYGGGSIYGRYGRGFYPYRGGYYHGGHEVGGGGFHGGGIGGGGFHGGGMGGGGFHGGGGHR